jgi:hypothetical protein
MHWPIHHIQGSCEWSVGVLLVQLGAGSLRPTGQRVLDLFRHW